MRHLDEGTVHAWLDGALSAETAAHAEAHVASCSACAEAVAEARGLIAASSRILLALDNVPSVRSAKGAKGAKGAGGAGWGRPVLVTWLVRERIAAVVALVVAGGALALVMSRSTPGVPRAQVASAPVQAFELAAADSPAPLPVAAPQAQPDRPPGRGMAARDAASPQPRDRDLAYTREADAPPTPESRSVADAVTAPAARVSPARTDDTARSVVLAQRQREVTQERSVEGKASTGEKLADALVRRRAGAEVSVRFAEPRVAAPTPGGVVATGAADGARLIHEERMVEGGREVRRRIYRADGILVTLDERLPTAAEEALRVRPEANAAVAAPPAAAAPDSTHESTNTIRWTDARGAELTLTGAAPPERLERIRKLLGF